MEDETGVSNAVVMPDVFERERATILNNAYLAGPDARFFSCK
jgi:hypothetical protein